MATPRKFSEKIALHHQKQAEETAEFEKIMREVTGVTQKVKEVNPINKHHLHINQTLGTYRGGSLPNVNQIGSNSVDLKDPTVDEIRVGRDHQVTFPRDRGRGGGPVRSRPRLDTSPYGSDRYGAYLSPPPDTNWRRTNSDSALHQSAMCPPDPTTLHNSGSPTPPRRGTLQEGAEVYQVPLENPDSLDASKKLIAGLQDSRPRSSCDVPRVPGINIYPSQQDPGTIQIPVSNNTGSLPDLSNFHFPPPLQMPLDIEDPNSSYSTSPQASSPLTLSPSQMSPLPGYSPRMSGSPQLVGMVSPHHLSNSPHSHGPSPIPSPSSRRRQQQPLQNLVLGGSPHLPPHSQTGNHLSVPSAVNSRFLHTCKGLALDTSILPPDAFQQVNQYIYGSQQSPQNVVPNQQPQQQQPVLSNSQAMQSSSDHLFQPHMNSMGSYRNPGQPLLRPSPGNSPGLPVQTGSLTYRSNSPGDTSCSAPQSPVSQSLSPVSSPGLVPSPKSPFSDTNYQYTAQSANQLQHRFEQFCVTDNPPVSTSLNNYVGSRYNSVQYSQPLLSQDTPASQSSPSPGSQDVTLDTGYFSPSPIPYTQANQQPNMGTHQTTPQTPQTPSSIPDIILTDFSCGVGSDLVKDVSSAIALSSPFDADLFPSDESLKEGLDPIDFDGFQMLTDPDMTVVTDPTTEDNFRLDRL